MQVGSSNIAEVDKWTLDKSCIVQQYATCITPSNAGTGALAGRKSHSGSMEGIYDPADPPEDYFEEGDTVTLKLFYTGSFRYEGVAVIESLNIPDVDIFEGAPLRWTSTFVAHGLFTKVEG